MPVILVGLPACGKSTVGGMLAGRLGTPFYDLDQRIEEKYRVSISQLFLDGKESYFRLLESQCMEELFKRAKPTRFVVATGGGAVLLAKNRNILKKMGTRVYLKATAETIMRRISEADAPHPLFQNRSSLEIRNLLNARIKYYMESDWIVDTEGKSSQKICKELLERITHGERGF